MKFNEYKCLRVADVVAQGNARWMEPANTTVTQLFKHRH